MSLSKPMLGFCQFGPRNKLLWNSNRNTKIFINENAYEDIVCEMTAILSRGYELRPILRGCPIAMGHWLQHQGSNTRGCHNDVVTMSLMVSEITSLTIVYSTVYSGADQRKHQSSASLAFVRGIHRGPVTRKMFPFDDVIMVGKNDRRQTATNHNKAQTVCRFSGYAVFVTASANVTWHLIIQRNLLSANIYLIYHEPLWRRLSMLIQVHGVMIASTQDYGMHIVYKKYIKLTMMVLHHGLWWFHDGYMYIIWILDMAFLKFYRLKLGRMVIWLFDGCITWYIDESEVRGPLGALL